MIDQKLDSPPITRFAENLLHEDPNAPAIKHFTPLLPVDANIFKDGFGNRMITSPKKAYFDRVGDETKAALLISPEGEAFIKTHKGILKDIDRGLRELNWESRKEKGVVEFGNNRRMRFLTHEDSDKQQYEIKGGGQSEIYVLEVGTEKYLIKKKTTDLRNDNISQPFINEMLQCQALAVDLKQEFDDAGVEMPTFLFASGQMACRKFEEGRELERGEFEKEIQKLAPIINKYLRDLQEKGIALWKNIKQDMFFSLRPNMPVMPNNHWLRRGDGKYVCIDPFSYID